MSCHERVCKIWFYSSKLAKMWNKRFLRLAVIVLSWCGTDCINNQLDVELNNPVAVKSYQKINNILKMLCMVATRRQGIRVSSPIKEPVGPGSSWHLPNASATSWGRLALRGNSRQAFGHHCKSILSPITTSFLCI